MANRLPSFPIDLDPNFNVALAANFQGIYQPDWTAADRAEKVSKSGILSYVNYLFSYAYSGD